MENRKDNFIMSILILIMIIIFLGTVYFCLDVFGIIQVPAQYSIASLFYSQIEVIAASDGLSENITETTNTVKNTIFEFVSSNNVEQVSSDVENPLDKPNEAQNNIQTQEPTSTTNYDSKRFYYNQLDEYGKILYDGLYKNIEQLKSGTYTTEYGRTFNDLLQDPAGETTLSNALDGAVNALILDNPEVFYIDITKMYLLTNISTTFFSTTYNVSIGANGGNYLEDGFSSAQDVNNIVNNVESIKNQIISQANGNTVEQIKIVHDYLVDTVEYDKTNGSSIYDTQGALINKKAVCEGYAKAFKYILDELGIPCIIVCGTGTNKSGVTESHAWNYVQIDGKWYAMDVTWDDPIITGDSTNVEIPEEVRYGYFLKGSTDFFTNHVEDEKLLGDVSLEYPKLNETNY